MIQIEFAFVDEVPEVKEFSEATRLQMMRFDDIAAMIADRNQPVWITSRKICAEMAVTIKQLQMPIVAFQRRKFQTKLIDRMKPRASMDTGGERSAFDAGCTRFGRAEVQVCVQ